MKPKTATHLPTTVEYVEWTGDLDAFPRSWRLEARLQVEGDDLVVETQHGPANAHLGEFVLRAVDTGEYWPVRRAVAARNYGVGGGS